MSRSRRVELVLVASAVLGGALLRLWALQWGFSADEVGTITPGGVMGVLTDPEIGANPPLYRLLTTPWLPDRLAAWAGRGISLLAGLAGIVATWRLARTASQGSAAVGVLAAAVVAVHPLAVRLSVLFRAYTLGALVVALHLHAVLRLAQATTPRDRRRASVAVAVTAAVLPWLHYTLVPLLLGVGLLGALCAPTLRGLWRLYVPAAVLALPLVPAVLGVSERRIAPEPVVDVLNRVVSLYLRWPDDLRVPAGDVLEAVGLRPLQGQPLQALAVTAFLVACVLCWRWLSTGARVLLVAALSFIAGVAGIATQAAPRPDVALFLLMPVAPLLVAVPGLARRSAARVAGWVAVAVLLLSGLPSTLRTEVAFAQRVGAMPWFLDWWDAHPHAGPVSVAPSGAAGWLWFHATGQVPGRATSSSLDCAPGASCFEADGRRWRGVDAVPDHGWLVDFGFRPPDGTDLRCTQVARAPGVTVWTDCGPPR